MRQHGLERAAIHLMSGVGRRWKMNRPLPKNKRNKPVSWGLRKAIRDSGLTAYGTAKLAGVSVDAVHRFLKNERGLTLGTVDKLADCFELRICEVAEKKRR
jgi:hypothetical protein